MSTPVIVETPARDGAGRRIKCPLPHYDREGKPMAEGPAAFRYYNATTGQAVTACRNHGHRPAWAAVLPGD